MAKTLIDIDEALLAQAAEILGTTTKKDTVNGALRDIVRAEMLRRHVEWLASDDGPDLLDPAIREAAWR